MDNTARQTHRPREPWNKGKLVGQKTPFKLKEVWAIRVWLQLEHRTKELALFDLGLDSKFRSCDLIKLRVRDIRHGDPIDSRCNWVNATAWTWGCAKKSQNFLSDLENSPHRFRALSLFKNRPLLDAFDQKSRADIFHRNAGAALGGDPVLNVRQQRSFDAGRDQQFFVADFACRGDGEFGGGHGGFLLGQRG